MGAANTLHLVPDGPPRVYYRRILTPIYGSVQSSTKSSCEDTCGCEVCDVGCITSCGKAKARDAPTVKYSKGSQPHLSLRHHKRHHS